MKRYKLVRITTVPVSLNLLIRGQMAYMKSRGFEVYTASADGPEIDDLTSRENVSHQIIPMTRKITPWKDLNALGRLIRWFREIRPDIVHSHTPKAGLLAMMAAKIAGVPHRLHTVAGMPLMEARGPKRFILDRVEAITYACATNVYPNSNNLKLFIEENFSASTRNLKVLGHGSSNGIDTGFFQRSDEVTAKGNQIRSELRIPQDVLVYCFIGRIVKDKGINELVEAFLNIHRENEKTRLLLVGPFEDDLDPVSDQTRKSINSNPAIIITGFQKDIRPYLAASDIFVFPSYREGFPNVVLQAGCLELPCIVSDINGCNEIIRDGENGRIVPAKDSAALLKAMHELSGDAEKRRLMGKASRKRIVRDFEQSVLWDNIYQEYVSLLSCTDPL